VRRVAQQTGSVPPLLEASAQQALIAYGWPGNIRELQNALERAVILCNGRISLAELPEVFTRPAGDGSPGSASAPLRDLEREAIVAALADCTGNRRQAAQRLGISLRTLQYRIKEYGLRV